MKIAFGTDWHLDFISNDKIKVFFNSLNETDADVIVVSGDIAEGDSIENYLINLNNITNKPVYFVLGNHDYYRSSYCEVRENIRVVCSHLSNVSWLESRHIKLNKRTVLCGYDGWYDGDYGDYYTSKFQLLDFDLIRDFRYKNKFEIKKVMEQFSNMAAENIRRELPKLLDENELVVFVTHVPPFKELCYYNKKRTNDEALPFFSSEVIGKALLDVSKNYSDKEILVLCGHTHSSSSFSINNINCICGAAKYGKPSIFTTITLE